MWKQDKTTGHWVAEIEGYKLRLQKSKWGNSSTPAWEIYIDGQSHGKELTLADAKDEATRELRIKMDRINR